MKRISGADLVILGNDPGSEAGPEAHIRFRRRASTRITRHSENGRLIYRLSIRIMACRLKMTGNMRWRAGKSLRDRRFFYMSKTGEEAGIK